MKFKAKISVDQLLHLVAEISDELHPGQNLGRSISMDSSFDAELGFDSLSRMELIHRIESNFEVSVSDKALSLMETPRDLLRELKSGAYNNSHNSPIRNEKVEHPSTADVDDVPHSAKTLNAVLTWQAEHNGSIPHVRILEENEKIVTLTYTELYREACVFANGLLNFNFMPGDSVVLMLPTSRDYFISFFGTLLAGGIPVPIYPPGRPKHLEDHLSRHAKIVANSGANIMITREEALPFSKLIASQALRMCRIITCAELTSHQAVEILPQPTPEDTAFIQYTSGSTGDPKGVVLSHSNLLANIRAMGQCLDAGPKDVFVSWLPLYHDMGLIGAWLGSLTFGMPLIIMSPLAFLARPQRWLWAIHKYKGTISGGPNFAYDACSSRIGEKDIEGLDLSSWRIAFNGAEPVRPNTLDKFSDRFKACGFKREALMPVYGLAENSVGLAFPPPGRGPKIDNIDRTILINKGQAVPIDLKASVSDVLKIPSCGPPLPGHQIRVVDGTGHEVSERRQGRIQFHGPSATSGYFRHKDATAALFDGDWRNSGDIGYLANGEVHITSREKDMIIRAGRNIIPSELETAVGQLEGIQSNNVAVFASPHPETGIDQLVVMAESRRREEQQVSKLHQQIIGLSSELTGTAPDEIVLVPPRSVPKTSSGKIRRQAARTLYEKGYANQLTGTTKLRLALLFLHGTIQTGQNLFRITASWFYATPPTGRVPTSRTGSVAWRSPEPGPGWGHKTSSPTTWFATGNTAYSSSVARPRSDSPTATPTASRAWSNQCSVRASTANESAFSTPPRSAGPAANWLPWSTRP